MKQVSWRPESQGARALLLELPEERFVSVDAVWRLAPEDSWEG